MRRIVGLSALGGALRYEALARREQLIDPLEGGARSEVAPAAEEVDPAWIDVVGQAVPADDPADDQAPLLAWAAADGLIESGLPAVRLDPGDDPAAGRRVELSFRG